MKRGKNQIFFLFAKRDIHSLNCFKVLKVVNTFLDNHSEDCSSSASDQKLNMELFAAIVFSCGIVSSLCSVPSASDQRKDIIKRMETCQEDINTVSEKLVTQSLFGQLSPKGCREILEFKFNSSENRLCLSILAKISRSCSRNH